MNVDIIVGSTLMDVVLTIMICVAVNSIAKQDISLDIKNIFTLPLSKKSIDSVGAFFKFSATFFVENF